MAAKRPDHIGRSSFTGSLQEQIALPKVLAQQEAVEKAKAITPEMIALLRERFSGKGRPLQAKDATLDYLIEMGQNQARNEGRAQVIDYLESLLQQD